VSIRKLLNWNSNLFSLCSSGANYRRICCKKQDRLKVFSAANLHDGHGSNLVGAEEQNRMPDAISYAAQATDERLVCLRIYADAGGETHMQDLDMALLPRVLFKDNPPLRLSETLAASGIHFCRVPSGMGEVGWHNPPRRMLVIWLTGVVEFETSDGDIRRVAAGSVVLAEDTNGRGHISRHPHEGQLVAHIELA
jgi:hypothetical protein